MTDPDLDDDLRWSGPSVGVLGAAAAGTLALAAAASAWLAACFASRDPGDLRLRPGKVYRLEKLEPSAEYTGEFLLRSALPLGVATLLCAIAFLTWHAAADRAAREWAGGLDIDRGRALGAWFVPVANLVIPPRALRELAVAHRAWTAERAVWFWWIPWAVASLLGVFFFNAAFAWAPFYDAPHDPTPEDLAALDKYGVIVGGGFGLAASAMLVVVLNMTAAVRGRYGAQDNEDDEQ